MPALKVQVTLAAAEPALYTLNPVKKPKLSCMINGNATVADAVFSFRALYAEPLLVKLVWLTIATRGALAVLPVTEAEPMKVLVVF